MVAKTGRQRARRWKAGCRRWKEADLTESKADPTTRVDSVGAKSRSCRAHVELPGILTPMQSKIREGCAAGKVGFQVNNQNKARESELGREYIDKREHRTEPVELSGEVDERATAVDAGDARVSTEEPIQRTVNTRRIEDSRCTK